MVFNKNILIVLFITLSLNNSIALDAGQTLDHIKFQVLNSTIRATESRINNRINKIINSIGQGRTAITIKGIEREKPSYSIDTIQPLGEFHHGINQLTFIQGSIFSSENEGSRRNTVNLGLGQRYLIEQNRAIAGVNLFVDYETASKHKRSSLGLEYQRSNFGFVANKYFPLSDKKVIGDYTEEPLAGYDVSLSGQMPYTPWASIKGKHYHWDQKAGDRISGNTIGVELALSPSTKIEFGQDDSNTSDKQRYAKLSVKLPFDENERMTNFALDDTPFRPSTMMNLANLETVKRSQKIKIEKQLNNTVPVFTSSAAASVSENQTNAITLVATDAQAITYAISGGDSSLFSVDSNTGVVTFNSAPDYENPGDADTNNTYAFTATATDASGLATNQNVVITVIDVVEAGVTVSKGSMTVGEAGTNTYTLVLTAAPTANVVITPNSSDTSAATVTKTGGGNILIFTTDNWHEEQEVTVTGVNDDNHVNESVTISHSASSSDSDYNGISIDNVAVTMADDDTAGITVSSISGNTTEAGGTATFTVVLNTEPTANVSIGLTSSDTTEGTLSTSSLTFTTGNWNSAQTVTVTGVNDDVDDGNISYSIVTAAATSSDSDYSGMNANDVSVTNTDNDTVGITQSATSGIVNEGSTGTYTVVLDSEPTADVTVAISSNDTGAATVTSSLTFTTSNWSTAQTVTITGVSDADFTDDSVTISHSVSGGDYGSVSMTNYTATITDTAGTFGGLTYGLVTSPDTGEVWLDRNLGATQVCTASNDANCYGHMYQWGRDDDGHESRSSSTTSTQASTITPGTDTFIIHASALDWTTASETAAERTAAWVNGGVNDICPSGFSVPTEAEVTADTISATTTDVTGTATAFSSFLKLPAGGYRNRTDGVIKNAGNSVNLWTRTTLSANYYGQMLVVGSSSASYANNYRIYGGSVRCMKD